MYIVSYYSYWNLSTYCYILHFHHRFYDDLFINFLKIQGDENLSCSSFTNNSSPEVLDIDDSDSDSSNNGIEIIDLSDDEINENDDDGDNSTDQNEVSIVMSW